MRIFVTGASGQIGLPLTRALVARGHAVVGLTRGQGAEISAAGATALTGDIHDLGTLKQGLAGAELVFQLAGGVRGAGKEDADRLNRQGTETLLQAMKEVGFSGTTVFASTCAVYGDRNGLWVTEDYEPAPHTLYGKSKVAAEKAFLASGGDVRIARIAAVYGAGIRFMQVAQMQKGRAFLPGEGLNYLPVIHIDDCVGALIAIAEHGKAGRIYNVAGRTQPQLKDFYKEIHKLAQKTNKSARPVRFWSTWIPSGIQFQVAEANENLATKMNRKPRFTSDNLRLYTAGVRLKTDRLEKEIGYTWIYPGHKEGIAQALSS